MYGQLGNGTLSSAVTGPVAVTTGGALPTGVSVAMANWGYLHQCALGSNGRVYCWGSNLYGRLGIGNTTNTAYSTPQAVVQGAMPALGQITLLATSLSHACAGNEDALYCWGLGNAGQLGNGLTTTSNGSPVVFNTSSFANKPITHVSAGNADSTCVIAGGDLYCLGRNNSGQLGDGTTVNKMTPTQIFIPS